MSARSIPVWLLLCVALVAAEPDGDEPDPVLDAMRARVGAIRMAEARGEERTPAALGVAPVFRYSDERRRILDGTLWTWGGSGRPVALLKMELYPDQPGRQRWIACLASLSDERVVAEWRDGRTFRSTEPGVEMSPLPDAPAPSDRPAGRLVQMKRIASRFQTTLHATVDDRARLLPRPITRFSDPEAGLVDGAVFGWTIGTNPDALLVLELVETAAGPEWRYGCATMTSAGLTVRLDDEDVFHIPFDRSASGRPGAHARWMWSREIIDEPASDPGE